MYSHCCTCNGGACDNYQHVKSFCQNHFQGQWNQQAQQQIQFSYKTDRDVLLEIQDTLRRLEIKIDKIETK